MEHLYEKALESAEYIKTHTKKRPKIAVVLGSGLGTVSYTHLDVYKRQKYDLVAVHKQGLGWVNMDSQAPNKVVGEWLAKQGYDYIKPEFTYGTVSYTHLKVMIFVLLIC